MDLVGGSVGSSVGHTAGGSVNGYLGGSAALLVLSVALSVALFVGLCFTAHGPNLHKAHTLSGTQGGGIGRKASSII